MQAPLQVKDVPDLEKFWLLKQAEYEKRIENPAHRTMDDYLKPHMSQHDFNLLCELGKIQEEFTSQWIETDCKLKPPVVLTDPVLRHMWRLLGVIRIKALREELNRVFKPPV